MEKRTCIIISLSFLLFLIPLTFAYDTVFLCLQKGETALFSECNPLISDRTCGTDIGCQYCTIRIDSGAYCPANLNKCYSLGLSCSYLSDNGTINIDQSPPELTINSPVEGYVYTSGYVMLDVGIDEKSDLTYYDNVHGTGRWTQMCTGCWGYSRARPFSEGFNNVTFKAEDVMGNWATKSSSFFVDSKKPKIRSSSPRRGFADGNFEARFSEENPESLLLHYGNPAKGYGAEELGIDEDCYNYKGTYYCSTYAYLDDYDGEKIGYWFNITDIAGNSYKSKEVSLDVDTTAPEIEYFSYSINGGYVTFNITVFEENFDEISYIDISNGATKRGSLCTRLKGNTCINKKLFRRGIHSLSIEAKDKAGNSEGEGINFEIG